MPPQVARIAHKRVSRPLYGAIARLLLNAHKQVSLLLYGAFSLLSAAKKALALCGLSFVPVSRYG